jgi:alkanesulfonate monooxygenase SsuD/methylene tetrahydromethanopterin reductase-like flavin-dependent oxidoreductase (luciferase family)
VEIGLALDRNLGLSFDDHRVLAREAAALGFTSLWTNAGHEQDPFQVCATWWEASAEVAPGGVTVGISVVPVPLWTPYALAAGAATLATRTGGRFVLGLGSGDIHSADYRRTYGLPPHRPLALMRDWLTVLRGLLSGLPVTHEGPTLSVHGVSLGLTPPPVPLIVGALGPNMVQLAGELSDGLAPNWCAEEHLAWMREQLAIGARRVGRDPSALRIFQYIRVSVDDHDADAARRALARATLRYAFGRSNAPKDQGYRGHFGRMGFEAKIGELEARRDAGATMPELIEAFPRSLMLEVGYFGAADGAAAAFRRLASGLDVAILRVVPSGPGLDRIRAVMRACRPELMRGSAAAGREPARGATGRPPSDPTRTRTG